METIMILGASSAQIPLYKAAAELGYRTCAVSIPGDYPCFQIADECCYTDLTDIPSVIEAAKRIRPAAVASCGFDLMMRTIGAVCEELHLPGPSSHSALCASNKRYMKEAFTSHGVTTAACAVVSSSEELEQALRGMVFPVMVKAVDQNGSRGIYRCETRSEAHTAFQRAMCETRCDYLILEEFISGTLFGVEAMVQNGEVVFLLPNDTEVFRGATDIPIGHTVPCSMTEEIPAIKEVVRRGIRALGLDNTPINADLILHDGVPYIVEMTGRAGANGLSELTGAYYGVNYYEMILRLALGENVRPYFERPGRTSCISHSIRSEHNGILRALKNRNCSDPQVFDLTFSVSEGEQVRAFSNCKDRIGQLIVTGPTREDCESKKSQILSNITLQLEDPSHAGIHSYPVL